MKLVRLTPEIVLYGFDCGDEDLNNFLVEDAKGLNVLPLPISLRIAAV